MGKRIAIVLGHPDPDPARFVRALAAAYASAAEAAGHEVRVIDVTTLDFPLLRSADDWKAGEPVKAIRDAQDTVAWAEHLLIAFPLWLGDMPALLKGFLEQLLRPGFAFTRSQAWKPQLKGRSARILVTMGMPAFFYRLFFRAHSVKSLQRNILGFCGIAPVRTTLIGMIEGVKDARRKDWLHDMTELGRAAR